MRPFICFVEYHGIRRLWIGWLAWFVFVMVWAGSGGRVSEHLAIQHALSSGSYSVVDGTVENFHPMPHHGHTLERFEVKGIRFLYSDFVNTQCFNNTTSHGGPIRAGLRVRLTYRGAASGALHFLVGNLAFTQIIKAAATRPNKHVRQRIDPGACVVRTRARGLHVSGAR